LPLLLTTIAIVAFGDADRVGPLAHVFKFSPLPLAYFPWWIAMLVGYHHAAQVVKTCTCAASAGVTARSYSVCAVAS